MKRVIEILMRRDGNTYEEAKSRCEEVRDLIMDCPEEADEFIEDLLELEPDYIMDFI